MVSAAGIGTPSGIAGADTVDIVAAGIRVVGIDVVARGIGVVASEAEGKHRQG